MARVAPWCLRNVWVAAEPGYPVVQSCSLLTHVPDLALLFYFNSTETGNKWWNFKKSGTSLQILSGKCQFFLGGGWPRAFSAGLPWGWEGGREGPGPRHRLCCPAVLMENMSQAPTRAQHDVRFPGMQLSAAKHL